MGERPRNADLVHAWIDMGLLRYRLGNLSKETITHVPWVLSNNEWILHMNKRGFLLFTSKDFLQELSLISNVFYSFL